MNKYCSKCGSKVSETDNYCGECGNYLKETVKSNYSSKYYDITFNVSHTIINEIEDDINKYKLVDDEYFRAYLKYSKKENVTYIMIKSKKDEYFTIGFIEGNIRNDWEGFSEYEASLSSDLKKLAIIYELEQ